MKRKYVLIIAVFEVLLLIVAVCLYMSRELKTVSLSGARLSEESENSVLTEDENGITIQNSESENGKYYIAEAIEYEPFPIDMGSYDINISYETDVDNSYVTVESRENKIDSMYIEDTTGWLSSKASSRTFSIRDMKGPDKLEIRVYYWGEGYLTVKDVTVAETNVYGIIHIIRLLLLIAVLDLCIAFRKKLMWLFSEKNYRYTIAIILLIFFSSIPIFVGGIYSAHDTPFHMTRLEGLKEAMVSGQFLPKMHTTHLYGYGYATGQMYPQLFLYPSAIMRILGYSRVQSYHMLIFLMNAVTACVSFYSFNRLFKDRGVAYIGTVIYMLSGYRLMDIYIRDAVGEYCAMAGLPLVIWGLYSFVDDEFDDKEPCYIALALGYSFAVESHLLSVLFLGFFSVVFGLLFIRRFLRKTRIIALLKSLALTFLLNMGCLVPLIDYMRLSMNKFEAHDIKTMAIEAAQLFTSEMIMENSNIGSIERIDSIQYISTRDEMPYAIGYALLISVSAFLIFARQEKKYRKLGIVTMLFGCVGVLMSLYDFPWDTLQQLMIDNDILANIQFPWRLLVVPAICFSVCGCVGIQYLSKRVSKGAVILIIGVVAVIGAVHIFDFVLERKDLLMDLKPNPMYLGLVDEYLLEGTDPNLYIARGGLVLSSSAEVEISDYKKKGSNISFTATNITDAEQNVELPLTMYPGYNARSVNGQKLNVTYGTNQVVCVMLPPGFNGAVRVWFGGKWYWKIAIFVSIITGLWLIFRTKIRVVLGDLKNKEYCKI